MNKRTILLVALVVLSMVGAASANGAATGGYGNPSLTTAGDSYAIIADAQDHDIVSIADVTLQPGTTTTVPIRLLNSTGVGGIAVALTFNPSIVTVTTGVAGVFDSNSSLDYSNVSDGVLRVTGVKFGTDLIGDLIIATVTLEAVGTSGSCELGLSAELSNRGGGDVPLTASNGTFTISTIPFNTITVTPPGPLTMNVTDTRAFTATCYNGSTEVTGITVEWASSNMNVGTIDSSSGVVTAEANGTTLITATAQGVTSSAVAVTVGTAAELVGDITGDGKVNVFDMIRVGQHWGETGTSGWIPEDVKEDGTINVFDMILIGQHWTG